MATSTGSQLKPDLPYCAAHDLSIRCSRPPAPGRLDLRELDFRGVIFQNAVRDIRIGPLSRQFSALTYSTI